MENSETADAPEEWKEGTETAGGDEAADDVDADPIRSLRGGKTQSVSGRHPVAKVNPTPTGQQPA